MFTTRPFAAVLASTIFLAGCVTPAMTEGQTVAEASLMRSDGTPAGTAMIVERGNSLFLMVDATGLPPGEHGLHLHQTGKCDRPSFESAGGHLNPANRAHGLRSPNGAHLGDLPNITATAAGTAKTEQALVGASTTLLQQMFDADGTTILIHADPDDYVTDPSGNSGSRIVCGIVERTA